MLPAAEQRRVTSLLRQFDCNELEATIYLQCLSLDPSSVQEIARKMGRNRFTIHSAVEQLIKRGLLCETRRGKRRLIAAEGPEALFTLLEKKKSEIEQLSANVEYATKILRTLLPEEQGRPNVRFYEGSEGYGRMLQETLSAKGDVLVFSNVQLLSELVGTANLERYLLKRGKKGIRSRLIFPVCPFAEKAQKRADEYRMTIRYLPEGIFWHSGFFCWNDCVALLSYTQNRLTTTIIENHDIAEFFATLIFEMCWKQATAKTA